MKRFAIVLAAGKGSRMKSRDPEHSKVVYPILGKAMVNYVIDAIIPLKTDEIITVVGFGGDVTKSLVEDRTKVVWQKEIVGTGNAVLMAKDLLKDKEGTTIVLCGDTPLIKTETINQIFKVHEKTKNKLTVVSAVLENPEGYGRVIRENKTNKVLSIREDRDCSDDERYISEINSGIYIFDNKTLFEYIDKIETNNIVNEYYITDLVSMFSNNNLKVGAFVVEDAIEVMGVNDRVQLSQAGKVIRQRVNHHLMMSGVSIEDPQTTYISPDVEIGKDTIILPNTTIFGKCQIGSANTIGPNTHLDNVIVGDDNTIEQSWLSETKLGNFNEIGPFAKTRMGTVIGDHCRVGNFVEIKNSILKNGVQAAHISYIGDSTVGERSDIGAGSFTANYDGFNKDRCEIGKDSFISSGTILVAPVILEDNSLTGAGSVITKNVSKDSMAITKSEQIEIKHGYSDFMNKAKAKKEDKK